MIKKVLFGVIAAAMLLAVGLVALVLFVDVNRFKPEIQQQVKDRFDRTLSFNGDLSLKVFPRLAVALPPTTLSAQGSAERFASLESARVSVALWPLLSGRIEVDQVTLDGLTAAVDKRKDGSTNIDDLMGKQAKPEDASKAKGPATDTPKFRIGGIALTRANLSWHDALSNNTVSLMPLELKLGEIANRSRTPISLDTQFSTTQPAAKGRLRLKTTADIDLNTRAFGLDALEATLQATIGGNSVDSTASAKQARIDAAGGALNVSGLDLKSKGSFGDLQLEDSRVVAPTLAFDPQGKVLAISGLEVFARGKKGPDTFDVTVSAPKLTAAADQATGERVLMAVKLGGSRTGEIKLTLEGFGGNAAQLMIAKLALAIDLRQADKHVMAALSSPATASIDEQTVALSKLTGDLTFEDPALPMKTLKLPVSASLSADLRKQTVDLRLMTKFDETTLAANVDVRGFTPLNVRFDANVDKLNVDRYFPPPKPAAGGAAADPKDDAPVDLSALNSVNAAGQVRIGQLQAREIKVSALSMQMKLLAGKLDVAPLTASLYGGTVNATAGADAKGNQVRLNAAMTGVLIAPLMKDAINKDILEGRGNVKLDVSTDGATVNAMKRAVDGSVALALRDGAVKGINVAQKVRDAQALLGKGGTDSQATRASEKTDFSELSVSAVIKNGVAISEDLDVKSPLLRVGGKGQVDVGASTVDYTARVSVVGTLQGQEGRDLSALRGATLPIRFSGPFDKLSYSIDWSSAAQDALKSRAAEQIKEKLQPKLQQERDKLKDRSRELLKGLLRGG